MRPVVCPNPIARARTFGLALLLAGCHALAPAASALSGALAGAESGTTAAAGELRAEAHPAADIPARADTDEQFIQAVLRRSQEAAAGRRFERTLARQAESVDLLAAQSTPGELEALSVRRLESLYRHWQLHGRELERTRADLTRAIRASSSDAAELAKRRGVWRATSIAAKGSAPALLQRVDELVGHIERAEAELSVPLGQMLELGRRASALAADIGIAQEGVRASIDEQDRRLRVVDTPPLWQLVFEPSARGSVDSGLRKSLEVERVFALDYDAANAKLLPILALAAALLLPLIFWLRRRARQMVAAGTVKEASMASLSHPWAAWLVLVALGAVLYDLQGPIIRQQVVMLLAWVPVLVLLQRRFLTVIGPWAYLSAVFYFFNVLASFLGGSQLLYRVVLLVLNVLMLLTLAWLVRRARRAALAAAASEAAAAAGDAALSQQVAASAAETPAATQGQVVTGLLAGAGLALAVSIGANLLGNVSLATMLTGAVLDSSYAALAMYAGVTVLVALFNVLLLRPKMTRLTTRHAGSLVRLAARLGRVLLLGAWAVYALQSLRLFRPLFDSLIVVLTWKIPLGVTTLTLGSIVAFAAATGVAFWLAKTVRLLLADDVLPALSLPRGVGNSISTLSYYSILFLGLMSALAVAGFQVGQLAIVFGALGVGIGFGLQDVVKNFVSGLILMFERPIQPGDVVEVAGMAGSVRDIGIRATIITTFEGADVVVPNGMLLADKLINWTLNGSSRRINVDVRTGYDVSPSETIALLISVARQIEGVAFSPAPTAFLIGLAPGALEFNVRAWTIDRADWVAVRSQLAIRLRDALAEAGIEVPKPQQEVTLRGMAPGPLDVAAASGAVPIPPGAAA